MDYVKFLRAMLPDGPWSVIAISPLKGAGRISVCSVYPEEASKLEKFIRDNDGVNNLYWAVNTNHAAYNRKLNEQEIKFADFIHCDIDPNPIKDLAQERNRILELITADNLPGGLPKPTAIVDSGGGYQVFWKLKDPIDCNSPENLNSARAKNLYAAYVLTGDMATANLDRIMRLPGTLNVPNEKKRKLGREITQSSLIGLDPTLVYDSADFPELTMEETKEFKTDVICRTIETNHPPVSDLTVLYEWDVPEWTIEVITTGQTDKISIADNSRSGWLFVVLKELQKCGVPAPVLYALITDPNYPISESVIGHPSGTEKYAKRQIVKTAYSDPVLDLNDQYVFVKGVGGKHKVLECKFDKVNDRYTYRFYNSDELVKYHANDYITINVGKGKKKKLNRFKEWLSNPKRNSRNDVVYAPGEEVAENSVNLWTGFSVQPKEDVEKVTVLLEFIRNVICNGNVEHYEYLLNWLGYLFQRIDKKTEVAVVLIGNKGTGKTTFANIIKKLFGQHAIEVVQEEQLFGRFRNHLIDASFVIVEETIWGGNKKNESMFKADITGYEMTIELKGADVSKYNNRLNFLVLSNEAWVVPASQSERRFFVMRVSDKHKQDIAYFQKIHDALENGGYEAFLYYFLNRDITKFNKYGIPKSEELQLQKEFSFNTLESWWFKKLSDGVLHPSVGWNDYAIAEETLYNDYIKFSQNVGSRYNRRPPEFRNFMLTMNPRLQVFKSSGIKVYRWYAGKFEPTLEASAVAYRVPPLEDCRRKFDETHGQREWVDLTTEATVEPEDVPF